MRNRWLIGIGLLCILTESALAEKSAEERLAERDWFLPTATAPVALYVKSVQVRNILYLSGHGECGGTPKRGKVGQDLTIEEGKEAAQRVGLCMLASMKKAVGDLARIKRVIRVFGMVNATEDFVAHSAVIDGFSDVMRTAFGDNGLGARASVGMQSLPGGIPVEIEAIVELKN